MNSTAYGWLLLNGLLLSTPYLAAAETKWIPFESADARPVASPTASELIDVLCSDAGNSYFVDDGVLQHVDPCKGGKHKGQNWESWIVLDSTGRNGIGALPISSRRGRRLYFSKSNGVWSIIGKADSGPSNGNCVVVTLQDGRRLLACLDNDGGQGYFGYWVTLFDGKQIVSLRPEDARLFSSNEGGGRVVNGYCYEIIPDAIQIAGRLESFAVQLRVRGKKQGVAAATSTADCGGFTIDPAFATTPIQSKTWILSGTINEGQLQFNRQSQSVKNDIESFLKK